MKRRRSPERANAAGVEGPASTSSPSRKERGGARPQNNNNDNHTAKSGGSATNLKQQQMGEISKVLRCKPDELQYWTAQQDPFNPHNVLSGYTCKKEGSSKGALVITQVNDDKWTEENTRGVVGVIPSIGELVWGTPTIHYPREIPPAWPVAQQQQPAAHHAPFIPEDGDPEFLSRLRSKRVGGDLQEWRVVLASKWNGDNILFYRYRYPGTSTYYYTAKTRTQAFVPQYPQVVKRDTETEKETEKDEQGDNEAVGSVEKEKEKEKTGSPQQQHEGERRGRDNRRGRGGGNHQNNNKGRGHGGKPGGANVPSGPPAYITEMLWQVLGLKPDTKQPGKLDDLVTVCPELKALLERETQSVSFELCGAENPHLVCYDFRLALKPLFKTSVEGRIAPISSEEPAVFPTLSVLKEYCKELQSKSLAANEQYRTQFSLNRAMFYNHFITEGYVLYILDNTGWTDRWTMYKIKPSDIESSHFEQFDAGFQTQLLQAVHKVLEEHGAGNSSARLSVEASALQTALGLQDRMWKRFERESMAFLQDRPNGYTQSKTTEGKRLILLVGLPGAGKSTLSASLLAADPNLVRVNQDEMGTRKACETAAKQALNKGKSVLVDRCNFDFDQRHVWLKLALANGITRVDVVHLLVSPELCKERVLVRQNHPTIHDGAEGAVIIEKFASTFIAPMKAEGFTHVVAAPHATPEDTAFIVHQLYPPSN